MKDNKKLKKKVVHFNEESELVKPKKKLNAEKKKINVKSPKFWKEVWDDDEEDIHLVR